MACTTRFGRVITSGTRQWRHHFCTEASPPSTSPKTYTALVFRLSPKSLRSPWAGIQGVLTEETLDLEGIEDMWDCNERAQMDEFERQKAKFFRRPRSYKELEKFFEDAYDKMRKNETKYPGEVTKILTGNMEGWRMYKPTLEAIPSSLKGMEDKPEWQRIFMKNREMWHKDGKFDIIFEGDVFTLGHRLKSRCEELTEAVLLGGKEQRI